MAKVASAIMRNNLELFERASAIGIIALIFLALAGFYTLDHRGESLTAVPSNVPVFSRPGGYYEDGFQLVLSTAVPGAKIRYTLDGASPTAETGVLYTTPIRLSSDTPAVTVVRARVEPADATPGPVATASYFIGVTAELPLLSLVIDPADMWDAERGLYTHIEERGVEWERPVDLTFVDEDRSQGFQIAAGVRLHGEWTRRFDKKSLRLYFRSKYGATQLAYPLFPGNEVTTFDRLVLHNGGNDSTQPEVNWTLFRNALVTELALAMGTNAAYTRPVLLFINGQPWGIYQLRERIDEQFLADHYGIEEADILDSPANQWVSNTVAGDREHWEQLLSYVKSHDLRDPVAYADVAAQVDLANLMDYTLLQLYSGNVDWPEHNVNQFRARRAGGQWQWIVWDNDYSFGLNLPAYLGFEGDIVTVDLVQKLFEEDHAATAGEDTLLIRKLFENPDFRQRFLQRAAELLNTTFAAEAVAPRLERLVAALAPDIDYEIARWGSSVNWALSVEDMRDYVRRRPDALRAHLVTAFDLPGTVACTFAPPDVGEGSVAVAGRVLEELPWTGVYFRGIPLELQAVPAPGYRFVGWEGLEGEAPLLTPPLAGECAFTPRFEPLSPDLPWAGDVTFTAYQVDDTGGIEGDWFEVRVERCGGIDLRGWRLTDNDRKDATDEGSLFLADIPALAAVPCGTTLRIIATRSAANDARYPQDDLAAWDRSLLLYIGNGHLIEGHDAWFDLGAQDNLAVLAPGPTASYTDDVGIAFISTHPLVTAASFGVLSDGVKGTAP